MEHGARLSTSRVMAIAFIFMSVLIVLSLSVNVIQGVNTEAAGTAVRLFRFSLHPGWSGGYRLSGSITGATGRDADLLPEYSGGHTDHLPGQRQHA